MTAIGCVALVCLTAAYVAHSWRSVAVADSAHRWAMSEALRDRTEALRDARAADDRASKLAEQIEAWDRRLREQESVISEVREALANNKQFATRIAQRVGMV